MLNLMRKSFTSRNLLIKRANKSFTRRSSTSKHLLTTSSLELNRSTSRMGSHRSKFYLMSWIQILITSKWSLGMIIFLNRATSLVETLKRFSPWRFSNKLRLSELEENQIRVKEWAKNLLMYFIKVITLMDKEIMTNQWTWPPPGPEQRTEMTQNTTLIRIE